MKDNIGSYPAADNLKGRRRRGGPTSTAEMEHLANAAKECGMSVESMSMDSSGEEAPVLRMSFRKAGKKGKK